MAFTQDQVKCLSGKLSPKHIKMREANGQRLVYIEGWHAIAEANRIFGYDAWDRKTVSADCVWSGTHRNGYVCAYTAKVRITVRAGTRVIVREGYGTGEGKGTTPGEAHDSALKTAETDATKRALTTFGNPFGLALYDRELKGVRDAGRIAAKQARWTLRSERGIRTLETAEAFGEAFRKVLARAGDMEVLFDLWEQNVETVRAFRRLSRPSPKDVITKTLIESFRARAVALAKEAGGSDRPGSIEVNSKSPPSSSRGIDKSALLLSEPKRKRSKDHLRYVARQPCLICGRTPSHAHHLRFAQPSAMARKVSDEFVVPLCASHHDDLHRIGDEKAWWKSRELNAMAIAERLWAQSQSNPDRNRKEKPDPEKI